MSGASIWYLQRFSALLNLIYVLWLGSFFVFNEITFEVWSVFSSALVFKTLTTLVIASIIIHSVIGLWTVGSDYLIPRTLGFISSRLAGYANYFRVMYQLFFVTLSVTLMLITSFLIWWS